VRRGGGRQAGWLAGRQAGWPGEERCARQFPCSLPKLRHTSQPAQRSHHPWPAPPLALAAHLAPPLLQLAGDLNLRGAPRGHRPRILAQQLVRVDAVIHCALNVVQHLQPGRQWGRAGRQGW
jgi:hypothetical protein